MNIPTKESIISKLQQHFKTILHPITGKQIFYTGKLNNGRVILVCTPQSKLHRNGNGWVDITITQLALLEKTDCSILALRLEGDKVYYLNISDLKPYLTNESMVNNKREGDHWKLHMWPSYIQVLGNNEKLQVEANKIENLNLHL